MAFAGTHIACLYVGGVDVNSARLPVVGRVVWSESMASAGTTTQAAPAHRDNSDPSFEITPAADIFVSIGPTPDASQSPRLLLRAADGPRNVFCRPLDRVAWVLA